MKVLTFTPQYRPSAGGIEIMVETVTRGLRERGIATAIITNDSVHLPAREVMADTVVHRVGMSRALTSRNLARQLRVLHQIADICRNEKPDLIHVHASLTPDVWYVDRLLRKILAVPFVITLHGALEPEDRLAVLRSLLFRADALTAVSQAVLQSALDFSGRETLSTVIPNGISKVTPEPHAILARPTLTCVGRLEHGKGFDLAIEALAMVRRAGLDAELALIGHGKECSELEKLAEHLGLSDVVRFRGVLDHAGTRAAIAASSFVLVPSRAREGFSLVAAEAAMAGVPCIASRVGGLPETVDDGVTGLIVNPDDAAALASAAIRLLRDEPLRSGMGESARRRAEVSFDPDRCVARYAELYASVRSVFANRRAA